MSSPSIPEIVVSTFTRGLGTYAHILDAAAKHAQEQDIAVDDLVQGRLAEDQLPLSFQVQFTCGVVEKNLGRLVGDNITTSEHNAKTFGDLQERVKKTIELVRIFDVSKAHGKEKEEIEIQFGKTDSDITTRKITIEAFMLQHALPNFFFHLSTGYGILRSRGVPLGKRDYLASFLDP